MKWHRLLFATISALIIGLALVQSIRAQAPDELQEFFSQEYEGISIKVNATKETDPSQNITIRIWINCTSDSVTMNNLTVSVYGFRSGQAKALLTNFTCITENTSLAYHNVVEYNHSLTVPSDVWGTTSAELYLSYTLVNRFHDDKPSFSTTLVRNVYMQELEKQLGSLNQSYRQLNDSYLQLNNTFGQLNQTYWDLYQNHTALQGGIQELDNVRRLTVILGITTGFFVLTTLYLIIRKPKGYW